MWKILINHKRSATVLPGSGLYIVPVKDIVGDSAHTSCLKNPAGGLNVIISIVGGIIDEQG
jgi:hypothetical protein